MNEQLYNVSANPHVRDKASTHSIMLDVIIALLPATLFGFWNFGVKAIINTVILQNMYGSAACTRRLQLKTAVQHLLVYY